MSGFPQIIQIIPKGPDLFLRRALIYPIMDLEL